MDEAIQDGAIQDEAIQTGAPTIGLNDSSGARIQGVGNRREIDTLLIDNSLMKTNFFPICLLCDISSSLSLSPFSEQLLFVKKGRRWASSQVQTWRHETSWEDFYASLPSKIIKKGKDEKVKREVKGGNWRSKMKKSGLLCKTSFKKFRTRVLKKIASLPNFSLSSLSLHLLEYSLGHIV